VGSATNFHLDGDEGQQQQTDEEGRQREADEGQTDDDPVDPFALG
jgi:hypothetical protein